MRQDEIFDNHELYNKHIVMNGLRPDYAASISPYITQCKIKKAILKADEEIISELNEIKFGNKLNELNYLNKNKIVQLVKEIEDKEALSIALNLFEEEGLLECLMYLLKAGKFRIRSRRKYKEHKRSNRKS